MSTNANKKIISESRERAKDKLCKNYKAEKNLELFTLISVVGYAFIFGIISIITDSAFFSLILSFFSLATTFSFELIEWADFTNRLKLLQKFTFKNQINTILIGIFIFILIVIPLCFYSKFDHLNYIKLTKKIDGRIPNIITTVTFMLYFISFYLRNYLKKKQMFMRKFTKYS